MTVASPIGSYDGIGCQGLEGMVGVNDTAVNYTEQVVKKGGDPFVSSGDLEAHLWNTGYFVVGTVVVTSWF